MYKIKRDKKFKEQLEVENDNGEKLTLDVEITLDKQLNEFTKNWRNLEVMNINVQQGKVDYMQMGNAVISIMGVVFGENDAKKLIDFYNCNYIELIQDILQFIFVFKNIYAVTLHKPFIYIFSILRKIKRFFIFFTLVFIFKKHIEYFA